MKSKLKGHQRRITGLAFSTSLNILVSSGADAQVSLLNVLVSCKLLTSWFHHFPLFVMIPCYARSVSQCKGIKK